MNEDIKRDVIDVISSRLDWDNEDKPDWESVADRISLDFEEELYALLQKFYQSPLKHGWELQQLIESAALIELNKHY